MIFSDSTAQPRPRTNFDYSQISEIEDTVHRVHARVRSALNAFAPVSRIPTEVLGAIPSFLIFDRDRIVATHVCSHWRNTFLSNPFLWRSINVFEHPEKVKTYIERTGNVTLDIFIDPEMLETLVEMPALSQLSGRCHTVKFLRCHTLADFDILRSPCPHLVELYLEVPYRTPLDGLEDFSTFPSLKSLTLIGDVRLLRFSQPINLQKLGVGCNGWEFMLTPFLELLSKMPSLEELEVIAPYGPPQITVSAEVQVPVVFNNLHRLVFRGIRSELIPVINSRITYPDHTKIILTYHLGYSMTGIHAPDRIMFPDGMQLPTSSPPKFIRFQDVLNGDSLETICYLDFISVDGRHISVENRYAWSREASPDEVETFTSDVPHKECFGFLRTLDLSSVERFCIQDSRLEPGTLREIMENMVNLRTLVSVNGYPQVILLGLEGFIPTTVICPLLRRLVVRHDHPGYIHWRLLLPVINGRASKGFPLEQVTLASSFNEPLQCQGDFVELLEKSAEVTCDFGRNSYGWHWWEV